ncbi:MAG TPA: thioredoxin domain-containing protein [Clostridiales bacterium]|jgi:uncharacterized protein YyaL (SSP411 family)|nr:thioredoxin domain-containing protein [Clostridiales bacterium]
MKSADKSRNRLIHEKSPYLLQHAHNPVDWYPWGNEAFDKAKAEDKPIFLSIGYSTCHWCHVMERESFEDEEVASALNQSFISIKVDREERPDIDTIYMSVCQALTGQGGWPLSVFMTPDKKPFYAGTYFPKNTRYGRIGFLELLERISMLWSENKEELKESAEKILTAVQNSFMDEVDQADGVSRLDAVHAAFEQLKRSFDRRYGGFGSAPKFPSPHTLLFLFRYWYRYKNEAALDMASDTLKAMYRGGIHDHIGYGFSRYSTDDKWLVPHFEKMLYDNAFLAAAYLECFQATKIPLMKRAAEEIFDYILRDMASPEGGFYSAEDADSEGVEGKFYVWTPEEVKKVLGEEGGKEFCLAYDITEQGNFEGKNIPNLIGASEEQLESAVQYDYMRELLFQARSKRIHPHKDDKILTAWNGMMIAALAMGGRFLNNSRYTNAAVKAYNFIIDYLQREDGRLLARYRDGHPGILGYADDYAFLIWACIELFETTGKVEYLNKAIELNEGLMEYFWDKETGGLFLYGRDGEQLISRPKEIYDGATPSANSQTVLNLMKLSGILGEPEYASRADDILTAFSSKINSYPRGCCHSLSGILYASGASREIIIIGGKDDEEYHKMMKAAHSSYNPFGIVIGYTGNEDNDKPADMIPGIEGKVMVDGSATAYVCENFACKAPVTTTNQLIKQLGQS